MPQGIINGRLMLPETPTPTALADHVQVYSKTDNQLYFQSGDGAEHLVHPITTFKSYTFKTRDSATGVNYISGFYDFATDDANLNQGALTVTHGSANHPYAAHAFIVSGGNGATDGSDLVLTVSGTSIQDDGTRTGGDSEVIEATAEVSAADTYFETTKKWLGTITYTLSSTGGGTFNYDFNYGYAKYDDFGNRAFTLTDFEIHGLADAVDTSFDIEILKHSASGWTYAASGFAAGSTALYQLTTIYSTESDLASGEQFAFKRASISDSIDGSSGEGIIIKITTGAAKAIAYLNAHLGVVINV